MMDNKNLKTMLITIAVFGVAFAAPQPNKADMSNEIIPSGGFVTKNGDSVSASWGGFQASASLADDGSAVASAGGNGLNAGAGYGSGGAAASAGVHGAGTGNNVASAGYPTNHPTGGYGNGGKPGSAGGSSLYHQGGSTGNNGGFFDRIFAIPINVLQSVNTYLNQKQQGQPGATHGNIKPVATGTGTYAGTDKIPEGTIAADYGHESAAGTPEVGGAAGSVSTTGYGKNGASMMIPITALKSVQNLLNG